MRAGRLLFLPESNKLSALLLGGWNDMQVRLEDQSLGGPVADPEVQLPVFEGNHWQWVLDYRSPG